MPRPADSLCFYDREGKPITFAEWAGHRMSQRYAVVKQTRLEDGRFLSTVWLGIPLNLGALLFDDVTPDIFETALFQVGGVAICGRYGSETEAGEEHDRILARLEAGLPAEEAD